MKKIIYSATLLIAFGLISCKKEYACECTTKVVEASSGTNIETKTTEDIGAKTKEKDADEICDNQKKILETHTKAQWPASTGFAGTITVECKLD